MGSSAQSPYPANKTSGIMRPCIQVLAVWIVEDKDDATFSFKLPHFLVQEKVFTKSRSHSILKHLKKGRSQDCGLPVNVSLVPLVGTGPHQSEPSCGGC